MAPNANKKLLRFMLALAINHFNLLIEAYQATATILFTFNENGLRVFTTVWTVPVLRRDTSFRTRLR